MKIYIIFEEVDGPWGGGNQFIKALKTTLITIDSYTDIPEEADAVLFNSHHNIERVKELKFEFPSKKFIHRVDGPVCLVRGTNTMDTDIEVFNYNNELADITIFQSQWSLDATYKLGFKPINPVVINNASNAEIFNMEGKSPFNPAKVKLISSSWSPAANKGLETFKWLDENLDFNKYSYTFVGRVDAEFKNIQKSEPLASEELAVVLKSHDIFIAPNINDTFSNAINEAVSCGLPVVYLNSGGNAEVVREGGVMYTSNDELLAGIDEVASNYEKYQSLINPRNINEIAEKYLEVISNNVLE